MISRELALCKNTLDFQPHQTWPDSLPVYLWDDEKICGFDRCEGHGIDLKQLSPQRFEDCFFDLHPYLRLPELSRFYDRAMKVGFSVRWKKLFELYGITHNEVNIQLMNSIASTNLEFQKWSTEKKLAGRDFAPLRSVFDMEKVESKKRNLVNAGLDEISRRGYTKSQGVDLLEWICELVLMDQMSLEKILQPKRSNEEFFDYIKSMRFPNSTKLDQSQSEKVKSLPRHSKIEMKWVRNGDNSGIEFKLHAQSEEELEQRIKSLKSIKDDLWN